ncbi:uncharacterized protein LOC122011249 [Zingiber officinale]|uniref:uncharacterized protein LOC122011249 n=1 Tax=Zingiber officinale TaxID=94328 RepID=UPI001C4A7F79|nr:uncharacterized protein LOC122011249 [Zingiber officinale]
MAHKEGYNTAHPPLFFGEDFGYWKGRMQYYLKTQVEMWMIIQTGFALPLNNAVKPISCENWDTNLMKKIEVDAKATCTLQYGLTKEELNQVDPFSSTKYLWKKLIELHKGTSDTKIQDPLNGLHAIDQKVKNRDVISFIVAIECPSASAAPKTRKRARDDGDFKRVAEIVMVLSALGQMRGGKEPAAAEKALVTEAKERLVVMCEATKPKDLVSTEAVRVVAEDLELNKSKDPALGFQPPMMSIAENLYWKAQHLKIPSFPVFTAEFMEVSKETNVHSSVHSSQQLLVSVGAKSESRGTIASGASRISQDKSPMPTSSRGFHNSSTISHVPVLAWEIKSSTVQAGQGGLHITHQPTQGLAFFHAPSLYTNHNEIGKSVQRILQSKVLDHPNWIPPSSDYMNASLNCQICKNMISDTESLLVCDACEKGNHLKCLQSYGSKDIPKAEWHCPSCLASSNGKTLPPKYGRVTRAPVPAPRAAPNTSINVASKKIEDLDPNTSRRKELANNNSYVSQHSNSSNLGGSHYDSMVIGAEMNSRTNGIKRDNEKCDAVGDHLEETNGSVCANSDASCGYPNDIENDSGFNVFIHLSNGNIHLYQTSPHNLTSRTRMIVTFERYVRNWYSDDAKFAIHQK